MTFASRHLALVAAFAILGFAVATADVPKACFLGTEPNPDTDDKVEFVQRPRDPFACDKVMLGGHNTISTVKQGAVYVKSLKPPVVSGTEGADTTTEESDSTPEATTANMETAPPPPSDCQDIFDAGHTTSGVYKIYHQGGPIDVYCSMHGASGEERGYIVFQKRFDGSVSFDEDWDTYKKGFGSLGGEFWLGHSVISMLTATDNWELVVKLESFQNEVAYAHYATFSVSGSKYQLDVDGYSSLLTNIDPGDALSNTHQKFFTTSDRDNDNSRGKNCAQEFKGGWWFKKCNFLESNLNGEFGTSETVLEYTGIQWATWNDEITAIRSCEMMMRRSA